MKKKKLNKKKYKIPFVYLKSCFLILIISLPVLTFQCQRHSIIAEDEWQYFRGRVIYNNFEGGFYGIITDMGESLDPFELDEIFKKEGITIEGEYLELKESYSYHMWGIFVQVKRLRIITNPN